MPSDASPVPRPPRSRPDQGDAGRGSGPTIRRTTCSPRARRRCRGRRAPRRPIWPRRRRRGSVQCAQSARRRRWSALTTKGASTVRPPAPKRARHPDASRPPWSVARGRPHCGRLRDDVDIHLEVAIYQLVVASLGESVLAGFVTARQAQATIDYLLDRAFVPRRADHGDALRPRRRRPGGGGLPDVPIVGWSRSRRWDSRVATSVGVLCGVRFAARFLRSNAPSGEQCAGRGATRHGDTGSDLRSAH